MIPLNHRIDAIPIYIFERDDAWDHDRIAAERKLIEAWHARRMIEAANVEALAKGEQQAPVPELEPSTWERWRDHPVARYHSGESRFDQSTIAGYLKPGAKPTIVKLRSMNLPQWGELQALVEAEVRGPDGDIVGRTRTLVFAMRHGIDEFAELKLKAGSRGLTDAELETIRRGIGDQQWIPLAYACMSLQNALTPDESFR